MTRCRACGGAGLEELLDLGLQPVTNRYPADASVEEPRWPLSLRLCVDCALVQLGEPIPADELRPREPWIAYREPEGHLDRMADWILALPGVRAGATAACLSYKDEPLLERLCARGAKRSSPSEPGRADLVLARHALEHADDPRGFVASLLARATSGGLVILEVPDCRRAFETRDYGAVWEEHVLYFTPETFRRSLGLLGLEAAAHETYPYPMEDSLIAAVRARAGAAPAPEAPTAERDLARAFARGLPAARREFSDLLAPHAGRAALFGAGHRAAAFINLLGLKDRLAFVVDDDPNKRGRRMPGSGLPILGSAALRERGIELCLLCLSPESEAKVARAQQAFVDGGGKLVSVFPASPYAAPGARAR